MTTFGSVCSGIEAASVAWTGLGWKAAWFAEIEPFPSAVLKHHYPDVANFGDFTQLPFLVSTGIVEAPDILCGGTPLPGVQHCRVTQISRRPPRQPLPILLRPRQCNRRSTGNPRNHLLGKRPRGSLDAGQRLRLLSRWPRRGRQTAGPCRGQMGGTLVLSWVPREQSRGEPWTPNTSAWPNDAAVCSLSQVLETTSIPQRFYLSSRACAGILRRAEARGKKLPQQLEMALRTVVQATVPEAETPKTS